MYVFKPDPYFFGASNWKKNLLCTIETTVQIEKRSFTLEVDVNNFRILISEEKQTDTSDRLHNFNLGNIKT